MSILAMMLVVASTSLHITVWPDGMGQPAKKVYTLKCAPVGGTLPKRVAACTKLMRTKRPFAPTPRGMACTQIYGGPQEALVTGRFRGSQIRATFGRKDGCQIARWNRVGFLFPGASASANSR
ncbi:MAG: SSI family serine proteinase inhibitor [Gaiellaceae bacterium]